MELAWGLSSWLSTLHHHDKGCMYCSRYGKKLGNPSVFFDGIYGSETLFTHKADILAKACRHHSCRVNHHHRRYQVWPLGSSRKQVFKEKLKASLQGLETNGSTDYQPDYITQSPWFWRIFNIGWVTIPFQKKMK